jgi:hypothetical protein
MCYIANVVRNIFGGELMNIQKFGIILSNDLMKHCHLWRMLRKLQMHMRNYGIKRMN